MTEHIDDILQAYCRESLSTEQRQSIDRRLADEPDLRQALELHRLLHAVEQEASLSRSGYESVADSVMRRVTYRDFRTLDIARWLLPSRAFNTALASFAIVLITLLSNVPLPREQAREASMPSESTLAALASKRADNLTPEFEAVTLELPQSVVWNGWAEPNRNVDIVGLFSPDDGPTSARPIARGAQVVSVLATAGEAHSVDSSPSSRTRITLLVPKNALGSLELIQTFGDVTLAPPAPTLREAQNAEFVPVLVAKRKMSRGERLTSADFELRPLQASAMPPGGLTADDLPSLEGSHAATDILPETPLSEVNIVRWASGSA
ncbi:MAG: SAF domain-containing protein [Deltaproteobacteria bacterium]|nr:SAF domain-containing protein [Deltaproteobacteria bacterium]